MKFIYHEVNTLPKLAWCAQLEKHQTDIEVIHGSWVERRDNFFVEGAWDGAFEEGNFDNAYLMGTGAKILRNKVIFSTPYHSHERLHLLYTETGLVISPSLAFLLTHTGQKLNVNYITYQAKLMKMMFGVNDHIGSIPLASGARIEIVHFRNVEIDYKLHIRIIDKKSTPEFESFTRYRKHLANTLKMIMDNAASEHRKLSYDCITTISSGYDSTACSALAAEAGCKQAITFRTARPENDQSIGDDDSGVKIGEILGLKVRAYDRNHYLSKVGYPEAEFVSSGDLGQDFELCALEEALVQKIVIMGDHGDYMWNRYRQKKYLNTKLYRNDAGGDCLIDFRWRVGFFPVRPAFFGALSHPSIHKISNSKEMEAWSTGNNYDRPIARRIAEETGVPRYLFGQKKKAASVLLNSDERLKKLMKPESLKSFINYYTKRQKQRNKFKQGFYEILFHLYNLNSKLISALNKRFTYMSIPLTLHNLIPHIYSESPSLPSFLVHWGISVIQDRYETSYLLQRNPLTGRNEDHAANTHKFN